MFYGASEGLMNLVRREIDRFFSERYMPARTGLVTSYDPQTHMAKVMMQPEGIETEFLPIHMGHVGNGYGILVGLTPGDGMTTGDQVEVSFMEGDREAGRITSRLSSDVDKPPVVQSGEMLLKHKTGSTFFLANDGSTTVTDKSGATLKFDGSGNLTISGASAISVTGSGAISLSSGSPMSMSGGGNLT